MRVWLLVAIGLLLAPAARADLFDQNRHVKTLAGQEARIGSHAKWDRRCQPLTMPTVFVTQPPANGRISTRAATKIAKGSVGGAVCDGREFPAIAVYYAPKSGFRGVDVVRYTADYGTSQTENTVTIDVQ